ncbi:MAG: lantibiotic dehydratase, partial [Bacteroidota bacterium]
EEFDEEICTAHESNMQKHLDLWRKQRQIPRFVLLLEGDNELLLDLTDIYFFRILLKDLRKNTQLTLKEFLFFDLGSALVDKEGNSHANQVIISLKRNVR